MTKLLFWLNVLHIWLSGMFAVFALVNRDLLVMNVCAMLICGGIGILNISQLRAQP